MESYSSDESIDRPSNHADLTSALLKSRRLSRLARFEELLISFSPAERLLLYILTALLTVSALALIIAVDRSVSVSIPAPGGSLVEGEVGPARFINPILETSQPDQDLTALVYSGLTRELANGKIIPDLAANYSISPDGTTYTFTLRQNAKFQDGTPVTAADVLFTIQKTQDQNLNSPQAANWAGVEVSSPNPETVVFTLPHAYAPFIENTTLGILPKQLWQNISDEEFPFAPLNTKPVGSGPYEVENVQTDSTGSATRYDLVPFSGYTLGAPYLNKLTFLFFSDNATMEKAFNTGKIDAIAGISPADLSTLTRGNAEVIESPLPRVFGVFFNQGHNAVLADVSVRAALNAAIDKQSIVNSVLGGYGSVLNGPIPPGVLGEGSDSASSLSLSVPLQEVTAGKAQSNAIATSSASSTQSQTETATTTDYAQQARTILQNGGWTFNTSDNLWHKGKQTLTFTLSTANEPELVATANAVAALWSAAGIQTQVQVYPLSELNSSVIRPRNYDALLFGEVVGAEPDLYAFWDSAERTDPGLNLAMYANEKTDTLLSQARTTTDIQQRNALYQQFATLLEKDQPAVFLYSPDFLYIVPASIKGIELGALTTPADRFENVYEWFVETQSVWSIFAPNTTQ
ncbi:MAG TPA: peptide ABC transporter substrate-binding protein [Candidatus Paceibacterota bacterium]|nr:peptide ABC transporter substrate-binding protein [Candidatus Paceibacterota bacterium]